MGEFPESWVLLPVSDLARNITITDKKIPQKSYLTSGKFPIFDQGQEYIGGYTDDATKVVDCELPVVVFGDHTRVVKLVKTPFAPGADGVKILQPTAYFLPKLFEYFVRYLVTQIPNNGYARHYQHLAKSSLPIPPLPEQHRIVAKIEELFSELDKGVDSVKTAREQLKVYRQALLKHAFEGKLTAQWRAENSDKLETATVLQQRIQTERQERHRQQLADWEAKGKQGSKPKAPKPLPPLTTEELAELPELPEGWGWFTVSQLLAEDLCNGKSVKDRVGGFPVLRLNALGDGKIDLSVRKAGDWSETEARNYVVKDGDFLVSRGNGSKHLVGRGGFVHYKGQPAQTVAFPDTMIRVRLLDCAVNMSCFTFCWDSMLVRSQIEKSARTTAGIYKINQELIEAFLLPVPGLDEQSAIADLLSEKLSEADQLDQTLATALQQSAVLRQSILKKAFCGQLVKQDKNDEPASVLLERIRAEKLNGMKPGKREKSS